MSAMAALVVTAVGLSAVMAAAWAWQRLTNNIGWVDVFWTFGTAAAGIFLSLAWAGRDGSPARRLLVCAIAAAWALRLGLHLIVRVARSPEDGRYRELRLQWGRSVQARLFRFLQLQAAVSMALAASIALAADRPGPALGPLDLAGFMIALVAVGGEAIADQQLRSFAADPANTGKVCDRGLWAWSRHPNYLFEWLAWFAYPIIALDLSGAWPVGIAAWAAPALMFAVLRLGTGVPPLEAHMLRSRGETFRAYQARVPPFLPRPPRQAGSLRP